MSRAVRYEICAKTYQSQLGDLTIATTGITLTNLNLYNFTTNGGFNHTTIADPLVALIEDQGGRGSGFTTLRNNVITDAASLSGNTSGATDDLIQGNVFARQTKVGFVITLGIAYANGTAIQTNSFTGSGFDGIGVAGSTDVIIVCLAMINSEL